ncbi:hypothetical protein BDK51DRAFT_33841 [Blyttiomyces helicus]|uniref:Quinon protein alcohol dehydrogenase-like superfamily n=1 Tax=Blyttiomyces helicus TaxID=388810 RepID=A0A4P9VTP6_9FUNG|nr:hypothetical protein BDK51DRAFT_33841 [Blyttiomyces helicus]|eukprot:RKO82911.1 hypothetical protein BDK51DRAFT_33841 [Blyttiomyces helicus]
MSVLHPRTSLPGTEPSAAPSSPSPELILASSGGSVRAIAPSNIHADVWEFPTRDLRSALLVDGEIVYITANGVLNAVDLAKGKKVWMAVLPAKTPAQLMTFTSGTASGWNRSSVVAGHLAAAEWP